MFLNVHFSLAKRNLSGQIREKQSEGTMNFAELDVIR